MTRIISFSTKKAVAGVTGELAAACSRHLLSLKGGVAYAAVLAGSVAPLQPSGPLKPTAMHSDPSESVVLPDTSNGRMYSDMSGPLSDMPDGTTPSAHVTNPCYQQESAQIRPQFLFQVYVTPVPFCPGFGRPALAV